jgi:predicted ATPase
LPTIVRVTPIERDRELATLRDAWAEAALGRGGLLVVSGEAGAGKTTLVQHFAGKVDGVRVLWGACDPLATPRPLGPLHDIAAQLAPATAQRLRDATQPHEIFSAISDELRNPSEDRRQKA